MPIGGKSISWHPLTNPNNVLSVPARHVIITSSVPYSLRVRRTVSWPVGPSWTCEYEETVKTLRLRRLHINVHSGDAVVLFVTLCSFSWCVFRTGRDAHDETVSTSSELERREQPQQSGGGGGGVAGVAGRQAYEESVRGGPLDAGGAEKVSSDLRATTRPLWRSFARIFARVSPLVMSALVKRDECDVYVSEAHYQKRPVVERPSQSMFNLTFPPNNGRQQLPRPKRHIKIFINTECREFLKRCHVFLQISHARVKNRRVRRIAVRAGTRETENFRLPTYYDWPGDVIRKKIRKRIHACRELYKGSSTPKLTRKFSKSYRTNWKL